MKMQASPGLLVLAATLLAPAPAAAWVWTDRAALYSCSDSLHPADPDAPTHSWSSIAGSGTSVALSDEQVSAAVPIGFEFEFYGVLYTEVFISSNGFITFVSGGTAGCCSGQPIPLAGAPDALVALAWEDLDPDRGGSIAYDTTGSEGSRSFVVELHEVELYGGGGAVTAQIVLLERGSEILLHYLEDSDADGTFTVGIEDQLGADGVQIHRGPMSAIALSGESVRCMPVLDRDGDGVTAADGDCDDTRPDVLPGAAELCDGLDNDCDRELDEGYALTTFYADADGDGYGDGSSPIEACAAPPGHAAIAGDCDDRCATCFPSAPELCEGLDNDCDGAVDEDLAFQTVYLDADGDGFGLEPTAYTTCEELPGWVSQAGDCNDSCAACFPGAEEVCDGVDNDCDSEIDELMAFQIWADSDGDGYGNPASERQWCELLAGYVTNGEDCHDGVPTVHPGAEELCDGLDNDCDGEVDEGVTLRTYHPDADGDGFGSGASSADGCEPPPGYVIDASDCDDADPDVSPAGTEVGDGVDNDCDGQVDEDDEIDAGPDGDLDVDADADAEPDTDPDAEQDGDGEAGGEIVGTAAGGCACRAAAGPRVVPESLVSGALFGLSFLVAGRIRGRRPTRAGRVRERPRS